MKKIIALISILAVAFLSVGCFGQTTVKADIESVEIEVYGFDKGLSEIVITSDIIDENSSISVSAKSVWKDIRGNYTVAWSFVGDDLGCEVNIIDPCCTGGTLAYVDFGDNKTGKIILRATASSKNQVSVDLIIWIGQKNQTLNTIGRFYNLQQAYVNGILKEADIYDTAYYFQGQPIWMPTIYQPNTLKNPVFLSTETENKIKQAFIDDYYNSLINGNGEMSEPYFTIDDIEIESYCGTYNGAVVVYLNGLYDYDQAEWQDTIAGVAFNYRDGNQLRVYVEESKKDRPVHPFDSNRLEALLMYWENAEPNCRPDKAWSVFRAAVEAANMVLEEGPISQKQIDWITDYLKKAIDNLISPWAIHGFSPNPILCVIEDNFKSVTFTEDNFPEIDVAFIETLSDSIIFIHLKTQNMTYTLYAISLLQERQELSSAETNSMECLGPPWCSTCVAIGIWWQK